MKENLVRFYLIYSSLVLKDDIYKELGLSREGELTKDMLSNQEKVSNRLEVLEICKLFYQS